MRKKVPVIKSSLILLFVGMVGAAGIPAASAHTVMLSSSPSINSFIKHLPSKIVLTFADPLLVIPRKSVNSVEVIDPMNINLVTKIEIVGNVVTATLHENMVMNGQYKVRFRVSAQDGHIVTNSFHFTVASDANIATEKITPQKVSARIIHLKVIANSAGVSSTKGDTSASSVGEFFLDYSKNSICYKFVVSNLNDVTAIHLHPAEKAMGDMQMSDEVFLLLDKRAINSKSAICVTPAKNIVQQIGTNPSNYFIMFHTKKFPDGAIAGQLKRIA